MTVLKSFIAKTSERAFAAQVVMLAQSPDPSKPVHNRMTGIDTPSSSFIESFTIQFRPNFAFPAAVYYKLYRFHDGAEIIRERIFTR